MLSPLRAKKSDNYLVGRAITLEREPSKKKQITDTKKAAKRLRVITLQEAIEKSPILLCNIGKMNDWMAPLLFRILVVAIIFSPTVQNNKS